MIPRRDEQQPSNRAREDKKDSDVEVRVESSELLLMMRINTRRKMTWRRLMTRSLQKTAKKRRADLRTRVRSHKMSK